MTNSIAVASFISLAGLWCLIFFGYRAYCIDRFRQKLFTLRDRLFDEALVGHVAFDDKMYGLTRLTINGFIRYAHEMDLVSFLFLFVSRREHDAGFENYKKRSAAAEAELSSKKKAIYQDYHRDMNELVVKHVVMSSPVLVATLLLPVIAYALFLLCMRQILAALSTFLGRAESVAYAEGEANYSSAS